MLGYILTQFLFSNHDLDKSEKVSFSMELKYDFFFVNTRTPDTFKGGRIHIHKLGFTKYQIHALLVRDGQNYH